MGLEEDSTSKLEVLLRYLSTDVLTSALREKGAEERAWEPSVTVPGDTLLREQTDIRVGQT